MVDEDHNGSLGCEWALEESVHLVPHREFERRVDGPLFLLAAHMQIVVIGSAVSQLGHLKEAWGEFTNF
jgi:hypothetical protein